MDRVGRVVDAAGAPVAHAHVVVTGSVPMPEIALESDDSGRFQLRLPPGHFTLRATAGGRGGETEVDAGDGDGDGDGDESIVIALDGTA